jgi:oligoribonuclease (3'-5' exoribonuclease)
METKVKKSEMTVQQLEQEVLAYLNKTAKHLFVTEDKMFFKVIPVRINDKWYYTSIRFNGVKCYINITDVSKMIAWHHEHVKRVIKDSLFPLNYDKKTSIPNFRLMREKTLEIVKYLTANYTGSNDSVVKEGITKILEGISLQEKTQE